MGAPKGKYMFGLVKVGERGQIVIPKKAREIFKVQPGDSLMVLGDEASGLALIPLERFKDIFFKAIEKEPEYFASLGEETPEEGDQ
ncbi:MAG: AbrB/MazE/SpoVT family DNA-binding domain-containing protein [Oscillospiraceae bacterium]|nr:AbrB/MazE/SpoVT family DNA-binding domain-containing protein [Oscillospiraceae bacterium]